MAVSSRRRVVSVKRQDAVCCSETQQKEAIKGSSDAFDAVDKTEHVDLNQAVKSYLPRPFTIILFFLPLF